MSKAKAPTTIGIGLEPLDVLFFRDGRPFTGSERSISGLPLPQTFAGAIRTALLRLAGCDFGSLKQAVEAGKSFDEAVKQACGQEHRWIGRLVTRGPWLARWINRKNEEYEVFVPVPAVLHKEKSKKEGEPRFRFSPLADGQLLGWNPSPDQQNLRPLWLRESVVTEPAEGYLTTEGLKKFLHHERLSAADIVKSDKLFALDYRTGIGISPDRLVADDSQIFGRGFLALKQDVFLYAEVAVLDGAPIGALLSEGMSLPLGGEGRHALLQRLDKTLDWPSAEPRGGKQKPLVLLTTPCAFQDGWKPQGLDGRLVAAAVPAPIAFSGWDLARGGPKPTRFAVPAGSVYFLESLLNNWQHSLAESEEDRQQGWGCCLTGVWTDE
jgi:CRISPR-associated protein Cmr3